MYCKKCGNPLPNEGYICKFCGTLMDEKQIERQKTFLKSRKYDGRLKSEMYGIQRINYKTEEDNNKENKYLGIFIILGVIIFLIILAIIINISR